MAKLANKVNNRYCSFYYKYDPVDAQFVFDKKKTALMLIDLQNHFVYEPDQGLKSRLGIILQAGSRNRFPK